MEEKIFQRSNVDFSKLEPYGFKKKGTDFILEQSLMNGAFKAVIMIDGNGTVSGQVYDSDAGDIYLPLRVESAMGGFAEQVRNAYKNVLEDIREKCFVPNVFIGDQTNRIAQRIFEIYGDRPEFPWEKYENYGIYKNPDTGKWYAPVMNIDISKLDKKLSGPIEVMNLKIAAEKIPELLKTNDFYPAYHMNKKSWITLVLNDTLTDETVMALIEESHSFSCLKKKRL
ncbi:MAG: MmcQ/YjbR family DNA-binding protein [Alphaproteobacteria bacterium]|nr:MmcQ/YjbR family DNA-binding protein [Alphaproteobacteria bacterium]